MKDIIKYIVPYILLIIVISIARLIDFEHQKSILGLSILIITLYYLRIDNPHKAYLNLFSASLTLCFIAGLTSFFGSSPILLKIGIAFSALIYLIRFIKRNEKLWVDYLKAIMVLIGASIVNFIPEALPPISGILGFIYILDRLIIRRHMKKTTQIIVFSFLALVCVTFVIYGQIKANEATKSHEMALEAEEQAMQVADMARQQAQDAAAQARMAEANALSLAEQLKACQSK